MEHAVGGEHHDDNVGSLDGVWLRLLKFILTLTSVLIGPHILWASWVTVCTFDGIAFRDSAERFTQADARVIERKVEKNSSNIEHIDQDLDEIKVLLKEVREALER